VLTFQSIYLAREMPKLKGRNGHRARAHRRGVFAKILNFGAPVKTGKE
jgi:hypothetical protein